MDYLECIVVPLLRQTEVCDPVLRGITKKLLTSNFACETQSKIIQAVMEIDLESGDKTNNALRWAMNLLLDMCQTEAEQSEIIEQVKCVTQTIIEE